MKEKLKNTKDVLKQASNSEKNMNDILQVLQMQNKIPDFIDKDTGGILQTPQKQEKSSLNIQKVIRGYYARKGRRNDILNLASNEKQAATTSQRLLEVKGQNLKK